MVLRCNHREGITQGHEHVFTNFPIISAGVAPRRGSTGDDFEVTQAGAGTVNVNPGWAFLGAKTGDTKYYFVENTATETLTVPTGFSSVVLYLDPTVTPNSDGSNVVFLTVISGTSTSVPTDADVEATIGTDKPWVRLADVSWDGTTMYISDRRVWIGGAHHYDFAEIAPIVKKNLWMNSNFSDGRWGWTSSDWTKSIISPTDGSVTLTSPVSFGYEKIFVHPDEPGQYGGNTLVASVRAFRIGGSDDLTIQFKWWDGTTWQYGTKKYIWLPGDTTTGWFMHHYHFSLPTTSFQYGVLEFSSATGGGGQFHLSQMKLEKGIIPTQWSPRPKTVRRHHQWIYPWATDGSTLTYPITVDLRNYGATKRTCGAFLYLRFRDDDSWGWMDLGGMNWDGSVQSFLALENKNDTGADPARTITGYVPLKNDYTIDIRADNTLKSGFKFGVKTLSFVEYV